MVYWQLNSAAQQITSTSGKDKCLTRNPFYSCCTPPPPHLLPPATHPHIIITVVVVIIIIIIIIIITIHVPAPYTVLPGSWMAQKPRTTGRESYNWPTNWDLIFWTNPGTFSNTVSESGNILKAKCGLYTWLADNQILLPKWLQGHNRLRIAGIVSYSLELFSTMIWCYDMVDRKFSAKWVFDMWSGFREN